MIEIIGFLFREDKFTPYHKISSQEDRAYFERMIDGSYNSTYLDLFNIIKKRLNNSETIQESNKNLMQWAKDISKSQLHKCLSFDRFFLCNFLNYSSSF